MTDLTTYQRDLLILRALTETDWWERRIEPRLVPTTESCLWWPGTKNNDGYGLIALPKAICRSEGLVIKHDLKVRTHRTALIRTLGRPLRDGLLANHTCHDAAVARGECITSAWPGAICDHRACANADHLAESTNVENLAGGSGNQSDWYRDQRTHCLKCGLELSEANLVKYLFEKTGQRTCRSCNNAAWRAADRRRRHAS